MQPDRYIPNQKIADDHAAILGMLGELAKLLDIGGEDALNAAYAAFSTSVKNHFHDEEQVLAELGSELLSIQQQEHRALSRMLDNLAWVANVSRRIEWRRHAIRFALNGLLDHFRKEDEQFSRLAHAFSLVGQPAA